MMSPDSDSKSQSQIQLDRVRFRSTDLIQNSVEATHFSFASGQKEREMSRGLYFFPNKIGRLFFTFVLFPFLYSCWRCGNCRPSSIKLVRVRVSRFIRRLSANLRHRNIRRTCFVLTHSDGYISRAVSDLIVKSYSLFLYQWPCGVCPLFCIMFISQ